MYKLLLCWRYLLTRYLALVCIISVMLGVATLIVVNSVMAGFSTKLRERLHGLLSDIVIEARDFQGFANPEGEDGPHSIGPLSQPAHRGHDADAGNLRHDSVPLQRLADRAVRSTSSASILMAVLASAASRSIWSYTKATPLSS